MIFILFLIRFYVAFVHDIFVEIFETIYVLNLKVKCL